MPLNPLPILNLKFESKPKNKPILKKSCHGVKITQSFIDRLKGKTSWLSSDNINVYLRLVAANSPSSVHVVDSGWFTDMLMQHRNPQELYWFNNRLESKSVRWFDHNYHYSS